MERCYLIRANAVGATGLASLACIADEALLRWAQCSPGSRSYRLTGASDTEVTVDLAFWSDDFVARRELSATLGDVELHADVIANRRIG